MLWFQFDSEVNCVISSLIKITIEICKSRVICISHNYFSHDWNTSFDNIIVKKSAIMYNCVRLYLKFCSAWIRENIHLIHFLIYIVFLFGFRSVLNKIQWFYLIICHPHGIFYTKHELLQTFFFTDLKIFTLKFAWQKFVSLLSKSFHQLLFNFQFKGATVCCSHNMEHPQCVHTSIIWYITNVYSLL